MSDVIYEKSRKSAEIPVFLREMLLRQYGSEVNRIEAGYAVERPVTFRVNTLKTSAEAVTKELECRGIVFRRVSWYEDAFIIEGVREAEIQKLELYERGEIYLQSLSSMLPPLLMDPQAGEAILDMTAAPGGKTTQLAALSGGKALITACEKDKIRFDRLKFNLARQGASRVNAMQVDASKLDDFFRFDKILLDAPCSGSGTIRMSESIHITEKLISGCQRSQEALLTKALKLLKRGGTLIYSTCSVLKQENEEVLERVLPKLGGRLCPIEELFIKDFPLLLGKEGTVTVCPDDLFEGFFIAKIQK